MTKILCMLLFYNSFGTMYPSNYKMSSGTIQDQKIYVCIWITVTYFDFLWTNIGPKKLSLRNRLLLSRTIFFEIEKIESENCMRGQQLLGSYYQIMTCFFSVVRVFVYNCQEKTTCHPCCGTSIKPLELRRLE